MKLKLFGSIADFAGFKEKEIKLERPTKIRDIIYIDQISEDRIIIQVNYKPATFDTVVKNDDYVTIMPVISGGYTL